MPDYVTLEEMTDEELYQLRSELSRKFAKRIALMFAVKLAVYLTIREVAKRAAK